MMTAKRPSPTRALLKEYGYRPKKRRGQHFLVRDEILKRIAAAARLGPDDTVVEIGPGPGNLTRLLARDAGRVIAVEIDAELAAILRAEVKAENLTVIEGDALDLDFHELQPEQGKLKVVANLPYNITTPVLFKFLDAPELFSELLLLVQKEVAERIAAPPGRPPYGILSVRSQLLADCEIALTVGPESFSPRPKVDSALVRLTMLDQPRAAIANLEFFIRVVRTAFGQRRKTILNSLSSLDPNLSREALSAALAAGGIEPGRRPETLTVPEFAALTHTLDGKIQRPVF